MSYEDRQRVIGLRGHRTAPSETQERATSSVTKPPVAAPAPAPLPPLEAIDKILLLIVATNVAHAHKRLDISQWMFLCIPKPTLLFIAPFRLPIVAFHPFLSLQTIHAAI